ncbi:MAG: polysaccharide pyruvyl transferase family protein [Bacteroidales bacterium]|nr:polysaccharide pyruvyl transferase family protein [Bacteroidales bacterium]
MKIAILTQPLKTNYGGILQAYALQTILSRSGHSVTVINRRHKWEVGEKMSLFVLLLRMASFIKTIVRKWILRRRGYVLMSPFSPDYHSRLTEQDPLPFVRRHINLSRKIFTSEALNEYLKHKEFDAYVVGSDQVWRPCYSPCITDFFLKEVPLSPTVLRIAYAASFGTDVWEFSEEETTECAALARDFDAISVREQSGIQMCKKYLGVKAVHLLDPTLLLDVEDYISLIERADTKRNSGNLFCYILDENPDADKILSSLQNDGYRPYYAGLDPMKYNISVEQWLRNFYDAALIVTDSFHACVFSILFKKPFVVLRNEDRGTARLDSLLGIFGLEDCAVESYNEYVERRDLIAKAYDNDRVAEVLDDWRGKTNDFLKSVGL